MILLATKCSFSITHYGSKKTKCHKLMMVLAGEEWPLVSHPSYVDVLDSSARLVSPNIMEGSDSQKRQAKQRWPKRALNNARPRPYLVWERHATLYPWRHFRQIQRGTRRRYSVANSRSDPRPGIDANLLVRCASSTHTMIVSLSREEIRWRILSLGSAWIPSLGMGHIEVGAKKV